MNFKQKVHQYCLNVVAENIIALENNLRELTEGVKNDSKSSAGDKHETSISMMQLEQEKIRKQLKEALEQKVELEKINPALISHQIGKGSLIKANNLFIYISSALGKITVDNKIIIVLSPQSPLGIQLIGKKKLETADVNGIKYTIETIE